MVGWVSTEIHVIWGSEQIVRRRRDRENATVVVSSSSARRWPREIHASLCGRGFRRILRPFGVHEFLRPRYEEPVQPASRLRAANRSLVENRVREYLEVVELPEAQGVEARLRIHWLLSRYMALVRRGGEPPGESGSRPALDPLDVFTQSGRAM